MKTLKVIAAAFVGLALSTSAYGGDEIEVIVHSEAPLAKMDQSELRPIFQTTRTSWEGGKALPLNLPDDDSSRRGFDAAVLGLDPDRVARYWVDRKIRGGNPPPKNIPSAAMIVKLVSSKKEAIGYVPAGTSLSGVKVVAKIRGGQVVAP